MYIGDRLKELREKHNIQQGAMANLLCISRQSYCYLEKGENPFTGKPPGLKLRGLLAAARVMNITLSAMLEGVDNV